jgi:hypothetical protein
MAFHDTYTVKSGDSLAKIGKAYGFANPGPIVAYPPNSQRFLNKSPSLIHPNEKFVVPWHPDLLHKYIATCQHLMSEVTKTATRLIKEQMHNKKELDDFLFLIDAANFLAGAAVGIGSLAVQGMKGAEMSSKEALIWLAESRASLASGVTTMVVPSPTAPRKDFKFWVRHSLGPWNPSFWASVVTAIQEKDVDIYLYGSDAVAYKTSQRIKQQADRDLASLKEKIAAADSQLGGSFYQKKI